MCCAALGPHQAAITAIEGKLEAVRIAMTASVKLMIGELGDAVEAAGSASSPGATWRPGVEAGVMGLEVCCVVSRRCSAFGFRLKLRGGDRVEIMWVLTSESETGVLCFVLLQAVADEATQAAAASHEEGMQL